jgi:hypothetical protein
MSNSALAGLAGKETGMKSIPSDTLSLTLALALILPDGEIILTLSPSLIPKHNASLVDTSSEASGKNSVNREALELLEPLPNR